ncbi:MAG: ABC transporter permease [Spartobacteria bacterium]|nr:ABC transporter permease [Spartobacteria bacterium]
MNRILTIANIVWVDLLRRKDVYVLLILLGVMLFGLLSINIFGLGGAARYVLDVGLLLTWICSIILAVTMAGRQLPTEESRGTIYPLLAKPIRRWELLVGKWLGAWSSVAASTVVFYVLLLVVYRARGGVIDYNTLVQAILLHLAALGMVCALLLAISTRLTYGAAATVGFVLVVGSFLLVPRIPWFIAADPGANTIGLRILYYLLPHFELFDMRQRLVHQWSDISGAVSWGIIAIILVYGMVMTAIFLLLAWLGYRTKHFKRGGAV